jgi:Raf kinase inhibitor-like YbhB/YbcL family protein
MTALALLLQLVLRSSAFSEGAPIPKEHTCDGADRSPAVEISELPPATQSWALIVDDPDAPGGTFVHWVIWNLPARLRSLPAGVPKEVLDLPDGSRQGKSDFGKVGYNGPCPPRGKPHHYRFRAFVLDGKLALPPRSSAGDLERAVKGHLLGEATLTGTFGH